MMKFNVSVKKKKKQKYTKKGLCLIICTQILSLPQESDYIGVQSLLTHLTYFSKDVLSCLAKL